MGEQKIQKGMLQAMGIEIQWKKRILRGISTLGRVQISPGHFGNLWSDWEKPNIFLVNLVCAS